MTKRNDPQSSSNGSFQVALPCTTSQIKDFIGNLLGETDELQFSFQEPLVVDKYALKNVVEGIDHRVHSQNAAVLARSSFQIQFDSGRKYKLESLEEIFELSPIGIELTRSIEIVLVYLIDFPKKSAPERQTISIYFGEYAYRKDPERFVALPLRSGVNIKIQFTERTWAEDISELIKKLLSGISTRSENNRKHGFRYYIHKYEDLIAFFSVISTLGLYVYSLMVISDIQGVSLANTLSEGNLTRDSVLTLLKLNNPLFIGAATVIGLVFALVISFVAGFAASSVTDSFQARPLLFSIYENDLKLKVQEISPGILKIISRVGGLVAAISTSMLAAYLYEFLTK